MMVMRRIGRLVKCPKCGNEVTTPLKTSLFPPENQLEKMKNLDLWSGYLNAQSAKLGLELL